MADQKDILEALRRGLITEAEAKRRLAGPQPDIEAPAEALTQPGEPAPQLRQRKGAFEAAGQEVRKFVGEEFGLDPENARAVTSFLRRGNLPAGLDTIAQALLNTGVQAGELIGGATIGGASLLGDVLGSVIPGATPEQGRREALAFTETAFPPSRAAAIPRIAARTARRAPELAQARRGQEIVEAGEQAGVPVLTTDIRQPQTAIGKIARSTAEKVPFGAGTGPARAAQQEARVTATEDILREFGATADAPLEARIIEGLSQTQKASQARAATIRTQAVDSLNQFGDVPTKSATSEIAQQIAREEGLGTLARQDLLQRLRSVDGALGGDFELLTRVRSEVISDIEQLSRGQHSVLIQRDASALRKVKAAIDKDLQTFAKANDPEAAAKFTKSNELFAEEFSKFKRSELRNVLSRGETTPEVAAQVLRGGKTSELERLASNAGQEGRAAARAAIIRDAVNKAGGFINLNPDRITNEFLKPNTQKAIKAFFKGDDRKRLDGFVKLLDATREAQRAATTTPTGQQLIPFATGGAAIVDPLSTFIGVAGIGGAGRAYESKAFRDFLLRAANTPKDTRQFNELAANFAAALNDAVTATQLAQSAGAEQ